MINEVGKHCLKAARVIPQAGVTKNRPYAMLMDYWTPRCSSIPCLPVQRDLREQRRISPRLTAYACHKYS